VSRPTLEPTQPIIQWLPGTLSPGVKQPRREADHSPPPIAEVKNVGAMSPPPLCLHGVVLNSLSTGTDLPFLALSLEGSYTHSALFFTFVRLVRVSAGAQPLQCPPHARVGEVDALSGEPLRRSLTVKYVQVITAMWLHLHVLTSETHV
jgi:hypothetical protein